MKMPQCAGPSTGNKTCQEGGQLISGLSRASIWVCTHQLCFLSFISRTRTYLGSTAEDFERVGNLKLRWKATWRKGLERIPSDVDFLLQMGTGKEVEMEYKEAQASTPKIKEPSRKARWSCLPPDDCNGAVAPTHAQVNSSDQVCDPGTPVTKCATLEHSSRRLVPSTSTPRWPGHTSMGFTSHL